MRSEQLERGKKLNDSNQIRKDPRIREQKDESNEYISIYMGKERK